MRVIYRVFIESVSEHILRPYRLGSSNVHSILNDMLYTAGTDLYIEDQFATKDEALMCAMKINGGFTCTRTFQGGYEINVSWPVVHAVTLDEDGDETDYDFVDYFNRPTVDEIMREVFPDMVWYRVKDPFFAAFDLESGDDPRLSLKEIRKYARQNDMTEDEVLAMCEEEV